MCRIAGFWDKGSTSSYHKTETLAAMRDSLSYGGPDAAGMYEDESVGLYLGHRRLSILDLSEAGTQPMYWNNWVVVFNGEIYNFKEVKAELEKEGYTFKTDSDTEVLLKGFEKWGREVVKKFRGMFSFALWNKETKTLTLCRDRVGVKPLFVYQKNGLLMFASELKAFHKHPHFDKTIDEKAVSVFLQQGYLHSDYCIYKNVKKIKPGSLLEIHANGKQEEFVYWDVENIYQNNKPFSTSENELSEQLEKILTESFMLRMVADVPVGMFLSGGIDSSLVTSIIQKNSSTPVKTFTIGFDVLR
jgi:asparagine synthase (glutamine-hydrolysing)